MSTNRIRILFLSAVITFVAGLSNVPFCKAEGVGAKNRKGNALYERGRYAEAEKEYLSAQVKSPGKPEILYNLGNSLIKQNKYSEGVQALDQSIRKGSKELQQKGWYNTGNALFASGDFKSAAAAYIRALKLNPSDKEAKHNLELAWNRLKQEEKPQGSQKQQTPRNSDKDASSGAQQNRPQQPQQGKNSRSEQKDQAKAQETPDRRQDGSLSKERAIQLLEAIQAQEREEQRRLMEHRAKERANGKDW